MSNIGKSMARFATRMARNDDGATAIEYGLLAALIAVACIVAFQATGTSLQGVYEYWSGAISQALQG